LLVQVCESVGITHVPTEAAWFGHHNPAEVGIRALHRFGQKDAVFVRYFIANDSIDGKMLGLLSKKRKNIRRIVDGDCIQSPKMKIFHYLTSLTTKSFQELIWMFN